LSFKKDSLNKIKERMGIHINKKNIQFWKKTYKKALIKNKKQLKTKKMKKRSSVAGSDKLS